MKKPSTVQGTRDFNADKVRKRQYIFEIIKSAFELYGFEPLETPAMERIETLMGKYGLEGDKLIFRILESGNPFSKDFFKALQTAYKHKRTAANVLLAEEEKNPYDDPFWKLDSEELSKLTIELRDNKEYRRFLPDLKSGVSAKALRYDLTIPFARYVAMNHKELTMPFRRYQMQPVWRADSPQKGRYREFYQCDADIVGSKSFYNEIDLVNIYIDVFKKLKIPITIKINHRNIIEDLASTLGGFSGKSLAATIDQFDKVGIESIEKDPDKYGYAGFQIDLIKKYINIKGDNYEKLSRIEEFLVNGTHVLEATKVLSRILDMTKNVTNDNYKIEVDFSLARGLDYYTGTIFEVKAIGVQMGSIGGGGRYDDLTGLFDVPNIPGVGISFGVDRIFDVMEELQLFPEAVQQGTQVLFFNLGDAESKAAFGLMQQLRSRGISAMLYHEQAKIEKQFKFADKKGIAYVVVIGSNELEQGICKVKHLASGNEQVLTQQDFAAQWQPA